MISKNDVYEIIFRHDTKEGKKFDLWLLAFILASVLTVIVESIPEVHSKYFSIFYTLEWTFTIIFTIEYSLRVWSIPEKKDYILSFWGIIDLLSIIPSYIALIFAGTHYLLLIRVFRLLRVFRIFRLVEMNQAAQYMLLSIRRSISKIGVFLITVVFIVVILGTIMYVVEGGNNGFTSIPIGIYWAIVTLTTVGFGDIVPQTVIGKFIASAVMILGYSIIAVPTGIITVEMNKQSKLNKNCELCNHPNDNLAKYCNQCGEKI